MSAEMDEIDQIKQRKMAEIMRNRSTTDTDDNSWPDEPAVVTDADFEDFVKRYPKVVIDCWAPWCGPCRMLSPTIDAIAKDMRGRVAFGKLNTDDNFATSGKFRISSIPTLLLFKDGKIVDRMVGAAPRAIVEKQIRMTLG